LNTDKVDIIFNEPKSNTGSICNLIMGVSFPVKNKSLIGKGVQKSRKAIS
jgi:hypothetical protein